MASRKIVCPKCGVVKPTPHEDAAQGLYERRVHGKSKLSMVCDLCGVPLDKGEAAIALTIPRDYPEWESTYLTD